MVFTPPKFGIAVNVTGVPPQTAPAGEDCMLTAKAEKGIVTVLVTLTLALEGHTSLLVTVHLIASVLATGAL